MPAFRVAGPTATRNSPFLPQAMAEITAGNHWTYPQRDGQAEWAWVTWKMPGDTIVSDKLQLNTVVYHTVGLPCSLCCRTWASCSEAVCSVVYWKHIYVPRAHFASNATVDFHTFKSGVNRGRVGSHRQRPASSAQRPYPVGRNQQRETTGSAAVACSRCCLSTAQSFHEF